MKLWDKYEPLGDEFTIIAFHDDRAKTFEELDEKLADVIADRWDGRELPFPILLDATGKTLREYGISAFPTLLLIDPEGKLVKGGGEAMLDEILAKMAEERIRGGVEFLRQAGAPDENAHQNEQRNHGHVSD